MKIAKCKTLYLKLASRIAYKVAMTEANTTCPYFGFQPELPKTVQNLSKVKT